MDERVEEIQEKILDKIDEIVDKIDGQYTSYDLSIKYSVMVKNLSDAVFELNELRCSL